MSGGRAGPDPPGGVRVKNEPSDDADKRAAQPPKRAAPLSDQSSKRHQPAASTADRQATRIADLAQQLADAREVIYDLQKKNAGLEAEVFAGEGTGGELLDVRTKIKTLAEELLDARTKITILTGMNKTLVEQNQAVEDDNCWHREAMEDIKAQSLTKMKAAGERASNAEGRVVALLTEGDRKNDRYGEQSLENGRLNQQIDELKEVLARKEREDIQVKSTEPGDTYAGALVQEKTASDCRALEIIAEQHRRAALLHFNQREVYFHAHA
jgi:predicted RNase H-like nuclease (RuvC/YqgF family)